jgi:hypothetical protein
MSRTINRTLMSLSAALGVALAMATTAQAAVGTSHPGRFAGYDVNFWDVGALLAQLGGEQPAPYG